jgi:acid phosphatase
MRIDIQKHRIKPESMRQLWGDGMRLQLSAAAGVIYCAACIITAFAQEAPKPVPGLEQVKHIIIIYLENRSFDNLYGLFPGANGIANAGAAAIQVDRNGLPYEKLPAVLNSNLKPIGPDTRFPPELPNRPFRTEFFADIDQITGSPVHRFYQEQLQINNGKMDKFVAWSDAGSLVMSYYDGSRLPLWNYAKSYTLMDNFFHAAFGGSFLNHIYLVCICIPVFKNAPKSIVAELDEKGNLIKDGTVTPDGYIVNTMQPLRGPHEAGSEILAPEQDMPTIGDRMNDAGITWAWYSGGWSDAISGQPDPEFQFHHQPFAYFKNTALGTDGAKEHLKDELDLLAGIHAGNLPQVVFFKPLGEDNEHPGYTNITSGEHHTRDLLRMIEQSSLWKDSLIVVTYDENGGLWDHAAPPKIDRWGPGARVPALLIGPFAKKGFVDHTQYDTTSILKLIETRFGLPPLGMRDAAAADMTAALNLAE